MIIITLARKPVGGAVTSNIITWGTGGLNIEGCRIAVTSLDAQAMERANSPNSGRFRQFQGCLGTFERSNPSAPLDTTQGRWPSNLILQHHRACTRSKESILCVEGCPAHYLSISAPQKLVAPKTAVIPVNVNPGNSGIFGNYRGREQTHIFMDLGSVARYFHQIQPE